MQAIECLEISLRTRICLELTNHNKDGHFYLGPTYFSSPNIHQTFLNKCKEITQQSQETFMTHYRENYDSPELPPLWMMIEVLSFGQVSMFFDNLKMSQQKIVSQQFSLPPQTLASWLASLAYTRNLCAHYSRLWNRHFTKRPKKDDRLPITKDASFAQQASVLHFLLTSVEPDFSLGKKLSDLLAQHPAIQPKRLGFSDNAFSESFWV
jgi:abortive infection bacteriophage resistance protein